MKWIFILLNNDFYNILNLKINILHDFLVIKLYNLSGLFISPVLHASLIPNTTMLFINLFWFDFLKLLKKSFIIGNWWLIYAFFDYLLGLYPNIFFDFIMIN
jgi:hypothetical protein